MQTKQLVPLRKTSSFHGVVFRIEELLRSGTLKPGEKLPPETQLARMLEVSRPTVREALKALSLLGFLTSRSGDGTYVAEGGRDLFMRAAYFSSLLGTMDFLGLIEARIAIEPFLAEMAALRASPAELTRMQDCLVHMKASLGDSEKYLHHEVAFHDQIIKAARSPILQAIMESLRDLLLEGRRKITSAMTDQKNLRFHVRIHEAIAAKNSELARQRMLEHLQDNRERYEAFYKTFKVRSFSRASLFPHLVVPSMRHPSARRAK
jgi:GntR family transcriptional regulator, transcriptional repressor for pyruvate dehydrogenase complex